MCFFQLTRSWAISDLDHMGGISSLEPCNVNEASVSLSNNPLTFQNAGMIKAVKYPSADLNLYGTAVIESY